LHKFRERSHEFISVASLDQQSLASEADCPLELRCEELVTRRHTRHLCDLTVCSPLNRSYGTSDFEQTFKIVFDTETKWAQARPLRTLEFSSEAHHSRNSIHIIASLQFLEEAFDDQIRRPKEWSSVLQRLHFS